LSRTGKLGAGWDALDRDDFAAAERVARHALAADAADGEAAYLLGSTLLFQNRFQEALPSLSEAYRLAPAKGVGHRLGYCRLALGDFAGAEQVLRDEVRRYPELVNAYNALGVALASQSRPEEALAVFLEAARRAPESAEANANAANALGDLGRHAEALPYLRKAVAAGPRLPDAHYNLGVLLHQLKQYEEAAASLEEAVRLAPYAPYALGQLAWNELVMCRWDRSAHAVEHLGRALREPGVVCAPFVLIAASASPEEQRLCAEIYVKQRFPVREAPLWQGERYRHDKLRIAYLSNDFNEHATAYLAAGLFEGHDRSGFEVIALSYGPDDGSPMRRRLVRAFDRFVDARPMSDAQAAAALREMEVDVVIDLKGHTTGARLGILAHRPAPVQATYLGFPGTTGAPFIDYLLADRFVVPENDRPFYSESLVYLPDAYQVNDGKREIAQLAMTRADAGLPADGFVFCCFNNSFKIAPPVFRIWMCLLAKVPGSVLWLLEDNPAAARSLQAAARAAGVDPARLVFAPRVAHSEHLARQRLADLFLDTLPCNAHTTASDALWGGLPVLACAGTTFAGRVAGSLLRAVGLPELVVDSLRAYEELALGLAQDPARLAGLRERLARNRRSAPLFDTDRLRRHIEAAYALMAERQRRGERPRDFDVNESKG
jgi:protein O-GlcNAc transferase